MQTASYRSLRDRMQCLESIDDLSDHESVMEDPTDELEISELEVSEVEANDSATSLVASSQDESQSSVNRRFFSSSMVGSMQNSVPKRQRSFDVKLTSFGSGRLGGSFRLQRHGSMRCHSSGSSRSSLQTGSNRRSQSMSQSDHGMTYSSRRSILSQSKRKQQLVALGDYESRVDRLRFSQDEILNLVEDKQQFAELQLGLRQLGVVTNETLKQKLHVYVRNVKRQREAEEDGPVETTASTDDEDDESIKASTTTVSPQNSLKDGFFHRWDSQRSNPDVKAELSSVQVAK